MKEQLRILLVEPFFGGSHRQWAEGYRKFSSHEVKILALPARHWKWRMHGAAVTLAQELNSLDFVPDLILATDMLDLSTFLALCGNRLKNVRSAIYFHENQITYPWSSDDQDVKLSRDNHYGFINYTSALAADIVLFNSNYHHDSFIQALPGFLKQFPDHRNHETVEMIRNKSQVMHLGMDLGTLDLLKPEIVEHRNRAVILWNHRWEHDKNPEAFFEALYQIQERGWEFHLAVLGQKFKDSPKVFDEAERRLKDRIIHWGYVEDQKEYARWLWDSDILPVTSNQDFFGGSVVEAMYCNVKPLLPNRLAYPEHVPEGLRSAFFYEEGELANMLQRWVKDVSVLRKQQARSFVQHYDWKNVAQKLDGVLSGVMST